MKRILALSMLIAAATPIAAQSPFLTTFAGGSASEGNMFDVMGIAPLVITGFDVHLTGTATIEIYAVTAGTSLLGNETNPAAWTLLGSAANVVGAGPGVPTPVPIALNFPINQGQLQGFYVTTTAGGASLTSTPGVAFGSIYGTNAELLMLEGLGNAYPFGATSYFTPQVWNGRIRYNSAGTPGFATKTPYGAGCYDNPRMAHEQFPASLSSVDLVNTQWTLLYQPGAAGGNYLIVPTGVSYDGVTPAAAGVNLVTQPFTSSSSGSWDDASVVITLPFAFPYPNATSSTATEITVNSNGRIYLGSSFDSSYGSNGANSGFTADIFQGVAGAALPVIAGFLCDFDPTAGGAIYYEAPSPNGGVRITWHNVPNWQDPTYTGLPAQSNYVQLELLPTGTVYLAFGTSLGTGGSASNVAITGFSAGGGEPVGPQLDWSTLSGYFSGTGEVPLSIDASNRPITGTTINLTVSQLPASTLIGAVVYGLTKFDPGLPLAAIGMPGCNGHASPDLIVVSVPAGGLVQSALPIPNNPALAGLHLYCQGLALGAAIPNPFGGTTSNGVDLLIGTL